MEFVKIGNASATKVIVEDNVSIQNSFVTKLNRKKMRLLRSFMTALLKTIRKPFKLYQILHNNQAH